MKILFVVHNDPRTSVGGVECLTRRLAHALLVSHRATAVRVVYPAKCRADARMDGIIYSGVATGRDDFLEVIDEARPDIIHIEHLLGFDDATLEAIPKLDVPYVFSFHDFWAICPRIQMIAPDGTICERSGPLRCARCNAGRSAPEAIRSVRRLAARRALVDRIVEGARFTTTPSYFLERMLVTNGIYPYAMVVVRNGIERVFEVAAYANKRHNGRFVYIGAIVRHKGLDLIRETFAAHSDLMLDIFGDVDASDETREIAREFQEAKLPNVVFKGILRDIRKLSKYRALIVPSRWHETWGMVIDEARSLGVPVVASDLGGIAEHFEDGNDGILFRYDRQNDFVEALLAIDSIRSAPRPVRTIDEMADTLSDIYRLVMGR